MSKTPQPLSVGEETFAQHLNCYGIKFEREHRFDEKRRWRLDFAIPDRRIGIEVEGGTWSRGRHVRGSGYAKDLAKYNALAKNGWLLFRYTTQMVVDCTAIDEVLEVLGACAHLGGEQ